jgi:TPP-dependent indolepyruvate ferredoxin oxidoreductase alpha subunit
VHPAGLVVLAVQVALVDLVWAASAVQVEAVVLVVQVGMDRMENMVVDLFQFDRIRPQKGGILFVVGEDHSSSLLTPTILL